MQNRRQMQLRKQRERVTLVVSAAALIALAIIGYLTQ
jgi:uncharacterized membrane-anchored protein